MIDMAQFIGIKYKSKGQTFNGCDCYGICKLMAFILEGTVLPSYFYNDSDNVEEAKVAMEGRHDWIPLDEPEDNCIVVINIAGEPIHCGYVINARNGEFIHALRGCNSSKENFKRAKWKHRIEGFYRYG